MSEVKLNLSPLLASKYFKITIPFYHYINLGSVVGFKVCFAMSLHGSCLFSASLDNVQVACQLSSDEMWLACSFPDCSMDLMLILSVVKV